MTLDFNTICRTCMTQSPALICIFETRFEVENSLQSVDDIVSMLSKITSIHAFKNDGLPENVCITCLGEINRAFSFKNRSEQSENRLKQYLKQLTNKSTSSSKSAQVQTNYEHFEIIEIGEEQNDNSTTTQHNPPELPLTDTFRKDSKEIEDKISNEKSSNDQFMIDVPIQNLSHEISGFGQCHICYESFESISLSEQHMETAHGFVKEPQFQDNSYCMDKHVKEEPHTNEDNVEEQDYGLEDVKVELTDYIVSSPLKDYIQNDKLDSETEEMDRCVTPAEVIEVPDEFLPPKSKVRYNRTYAEFNNWRKLKAVESMSEKVFLAYFRELAAKNKPTTLWSYYSMLKATIKINDNVDIRPYSQLIGFLKSKSIGYKPARAKIFSEKEIDDFINGASDELWLDVKVVCIFGVSGACRTTELTGISVHDVQKHGDLFLVTIPKTKTHAQRKFTITGTFCTIVNKYVAMRPPGTKHNRFFLNFQRGKCTTQCIGKHKFCSMPGRVAKFLKLDEQERYTGHSFRRTSATILANTGVSIETLKQHGAWTSRKAAEQYIEDSRTRTGYLISNSINCASSSTSANGSIFGC